jgi:hypothetical protein
MDVRGPSTGAEASSSLTPGGAADHEGYSFYQYYLADTPGAMVPDATSATDNECDQVRQEIGIFVLCILISKHTGQGEWVSAY